MNDLTFEENEKIAEMIALLRHFPQHPSITAHLDDQRTATRIANEFRKLGHECRTYPDGAGGGYHIDVNRKQ